MRQLNDHSIDFILCDLPYGVTKNPDDKTIPLDLLWEQYKRIAKEDAAIALFAQGLFFVDLVNSNRSWYRYDLIWDKVLTTGFLNANRMPLRRHEQIAIFYKKQPTYNPQKILGKSNHSIGNVSPDRTNNNYGDFAPIDNKEKLGSMKHPSSILTFQKPHPSIARHPTEKSLELCQWLIKTYTNEGDVVLDNCMGSGTTGEAAITTGRHFIGFEINEKYCQMANERIDKILA